MSERRACRLVDQPRGTQGYHLTQREDEDALTRAIVELASQYDRYGYRRITALLKRDGWQVGKDRVERIWRREGLKVPQKTSSSWQNRIHPQFIPYLAIAGDGIGTGVASASASPKAHLIAPI